MAKADLKRAWQPSQEAFERLLQWLDAGRDSDGERYLDIRDRLVRYFARRHCAAPDDLADETLNRVARRLEENGAIESDTPARYCYIVAKFVLLESVRQRARQSALSSAAGDSGVPEPPPDDSAQQRERTFSCLERCLEQCTPFDRQLILDYYGSTSESAPVQRKRLAQRLDLNANSLAIRAYRIRSRLEQCVKECRER